MPYTLERDVLLPGFLYGAEALVELDVAQRLLTQEMETIHAPPFVPTRSLNQTAAARFACFKSRLLERLGEIAKSRQPGRFGLVQHNLHQSAWRAANHNTHLCQPAALLSRSAAHALNRFGSGRGDCPAESSGPAYYSGTRTVMTFEGPVPCGPFGVGKTAYTR